MKFWDILLLIIVEIIVLGIGFTIGISNRETEIQVVEVPAEPVVIIETEIEKVMEPVFLRELSDWNSVDELKAFLEADDTNEIELSDGECEVAAFQLRDRAEAIGRNLEFEIVTPEEYIRWSDNVSVAHNQDHAMNIAIIGNYAWYVEPQTDYCWKAFILD